MRCCFARRRSCGVDHAKRFESAGPAGSNRRPRQRAVAAGIQKITAKGAEGNRAIQIYSPWGHQYSAWPKGVKRVAFTIQTTKSGSARINAPGFKEANKDEYKSAIDAVATMAIEKASAQKAAKSKM